VARLLRYGALYSLGGTVNGGVVTRRGRGKTVCARGAWLALLGGPSTSLSKDFTVLSTAFSDLWFFELLA
jgi:hypothetical protein